MAAKYQNGYTIEPYPRMRRFSLDAGRLGRQRHIIHGLLEVDVTEARQVIREHRARTGESLSFTAFIIACLAEAVDKNKQVHAQRDWRNRLIIFDDVNVNIMVEAELEGRKVPMPHIIQAANRKTFREIHDEIRAAQSEPAGSGEATFMRWFLVLPWPVRRIFYWVVMRFPRLARRLTSSVLVTAVGMFGQGGGWGIPMPNFPLTVTLGGIVQKPWVVEGRVEVRDILDVTLSFDHDIIDGAPAARFTQQFRELVEKGQSMIT